MRTIYYKDDIIEVLNSHGGHIGQRYYVQYDTSDDCRFVFLQFDQRTSSQEQISPMREQIRLLKRPLKNWIKHYRNKIKYNK